MRMRFRKFFIILKNLPTYYTKIDMIYKIKEYFCKFGEIKFVNVLTDKYKMDKIRDIAFIDFVYASDSIKALESTERFIIDSSIIEKQKVKKR